MARYSVITGSFIICICLMNAGHAAPSSTGTKPPHLAFPNGRWFDGTGFIEATFYAVDGVLTDQRPKRVDRTFDLAGRYVVPPFGEAHNHNIDSYSGDANVRRYLSEGIFYVKNPNALPRLLYPVADLNHPASVDLSVAIGSLTASGGHPLGLFQRN